MALQQATRTIPIVFVLLADPVGTGLVASLARPSGNITGFVNYEFTIGGKWLELLRDIVPNLASILVVLNPDSPGSQGLLQAVEVEWRSNLQEFGVQQK
jgi:putative ABC transport system substrate-binding protein